MVQKFKLVVYVPTENADDVRQALGNAGAGKIGNYTFCSFTSKGIGRSLPGEGASPYIGEVGKVEAIEEERIEVTVDEARISSVISAMKSVHPYEEIAYDVYPLEDL